MADFLSWIRTDGLAVIIVALLLFYGSKFANLFLERLKGDKKSGREHDRLADLRMRIDSKARIVLDRAVLRTRADRAYVCEFHNGTTGLSGLPFLKASCIYEVVAVGVMSRAALRQDMSLHLYATFMDQVCRLPVTIADVNNRDATETPLGYEHLVSLGVAVCIRARITDISQRPIGYVGLDYNSPPDQATVEVAIPILQDVAVAIGAMLSVEKGR